MIDDEGPWGDPTEGTGLIVTPDFARRRLRSRLRRWRPFLIAGGLVLLAALLGWLLYFSSVLTVESVDVSGNQTVATSRIKLVAEVPMGEQLVSVDLAAIQARVETIPAVKSVAVSRSWPHGIAIEVTERTPIAIVSGGADLQALDADGVVFGHYRKRPEGLPLVKTAPDVNAAALGEAAKVVAALRPDIAARVDYIDVATVDKISLAMAGGITVQWGSAEDSENKAKVLEILLKQHVTKIDVSVPGRPTTG